MKRFMNFFYLISFLFCCNVFLPAQEGCFGPVNPYYLKYQEQQQGNGIKGIQPSSSNYGYVPSPLMLNFDLIYPEDSLLLNSKGEALGLPARFDLRDSGLVSSVKEQKLGNCWAFAAMGSLESNLLVNGWGEFDLSEQHLSTCNGQSALSDGGSGHVASAYFSRFAGPVLEVDDPTNPNQTSCVQKKYNIPFKVLSSRFLPPTLNVIKRHIMKYGAVVSTMRIEDDTATTANPRDYVNYDDYYNKLDYTYYYVGSRSIDHFILLVGWDDNKIVTGGKKSPKGKKGAWIVKNSWGDQWGENGYFYISYYDESCLQENCIFGAPLKNKEIDTVIVYDTYGASGSYGLGSNDCYGLTRFTVPVPQVVKKIGTFILNAGTTLDVEIYEKFSNDTLSGLLFTRNNIFCEFPGELTIDVNARVKGDYFVKIHYHTIFSEFPISIQKAGDVAFIPCIIKPAGYNWISPDGNSWQPIGSTIVNKKMNLTIRSYNVFEENEVAGFSLEKEALCLHDSLRLIATYQGLKPLLNWTAGPDAQPGEIDGADTVYIRFSTPGKKSIRLIASNGDRTDTIIQQLEVISSLPLNIASLRADVTKLLPILNYYSPYYATGSTIVLYAITNADSIIWGDPWEGVNASMVQIKTDQEGVYQFHATAYQSGCVSSDTIRVFVKPYLGPSNDSIRNAIALKEGYNGPFTNQDASVEAFEPRPPGTNCNSQATWCGENGLQNTVWFTFQAPPSGVVSVTSTGFDNQLAVYSSYNADSLLKGSYKLLAANDDFSGVNPAIVNLKNLTPGEQYFLQMDGSNFGASGKCPIYLYYDKLFIETSEDTIRLNCNEGGMDSITITTNGIFKIKENCSWLTCSPDSGTKTGCIRLIVTKSNETDLTQQTVVTVSLMGILNKNITVYKLYGAVHDLTSFKFNFYPNPVTNSLTIENNSGMISFYSILDIGGRNLVGGELDLGGNTIDLKKLPRGLYLLQLGNRNGNFIEKFIKE